MARIEELIGQIADPRLRAEIAAEAGARSTLGNSTVLGASLLAALELFNARQGQE